MTTKRVRKPQHRLQCGPDTVALVDRESTRFIGAVMAEYGKRVYKADVTDAAVRFAFANPDMFRAFLLAEHAPEPETPEGDGPDE